MSLRTNLCQIRPLTDMGCPTSATHVGPAAECTTHASAPIGHSGSIDYMIPHVVLDVQSIFPRTALPSRDPSSVLSEMFKHTVRVESGSAEKREVVGLCLDLAGFNLPVSTMYHITIRSATKPDLLAVQSRNPSHTFDVVLHLLIL